MALVRSRSTICGSPIRSRSAFTNGSPRSVPAKLIDYWTAFLGIPLSVLRQQLSLCLAMTVLRKLKSWKDTRGQDLIEYALMAGFVAVAAGAIMPSVSTSVSAIFSKVASVMHNASVPT